MLSQIFLLEYRLQEEEQRSWHLEETCVPEACVNCNPSPGSPSLPPSQVLGSVLIPAQAPWEGPPPGSPP